MKRKGTVDIRWVNTPTQQRLVASCKRTLRSHSARVARSVWSRLRSCVVECRNSIEGAFLLDPGGAVLCRALWTMRGAARPASECGAEQCVDIPGTWESLYLPVLMVCGLGRSRTTTSMIASGVPAAAIAKSAGTGRVPARKLQTSGRGSDGGSLSRLIVALESRETFSGGSL